MTDLLRTWRQWTHAFVLHCKRCILENHLGPRESNYLKREEGLRQRSCFSWRTNFYLVRRNAKGGDHRKGISTMTSFQLQGMKHFDQDNDKSIKLWKSSATFLKARSVLGGRFDQLSSHCYLLTPDSPLSVSPTDPWAKYREKWIYNPHLFTCHTQQKKIIYL